MYSSLTVLTQSTVGLAATLRLDTQAMLSQLGPNSRGAVGFF